MVIIEDNIRSDIALIVVQNVIFWNIQKLIHVSSVTNVLENVLNKKTLEHIFYVYRTSFEIRTAVDAK